MRRLIASLDLPDAIGGAGVLLLAAAGALSPWWPAGLVVLGIAGVLGGVLLARRAE